MVIKNKQERSYSLWRFVGVAAIPMLLLFFAGFSLGDTAGKEKDANRKALDAAQRKIDSLQAELLMRDSFFRSGDKILEGIEEKVNTLSSEFTSLAAAGQFSENDPLVQNWSDEVDKHFGFLKRNLQELEIKFSDVNTRQLPPPLEVGYRYIVKYKDALKTKLALHKMNITKRASEGNLDALQQEQEEIDEKLKALDEKSEKQDLENSIKSLELDLKICRQDLDRARAAGESSNGEYKTKIKSEVDAIRKILPNLANKRFDKKEREAHSKSIGLSLDAIWQNADRIK